MANYNSGILYNAGIKGGGANYNSAAYYIVEVSDAGLAQELLSMLANIFASESGTGIDSLDVKKFPADDYLIVTCGSILEPIKAYVLRDSQVELLPEPRNMSEEVPGKHGELDFGSEYKARSARLHVATYDGLSPEQKEQMKRSIAKYLNPVAGTKKLVFLYDIGKQYIVKLDGRIEPTEYADWFEFEIPLKMSDPFIESTDEHSLTGSGTITNAGNFETGLIVEIAGSATNPSVTIGTNVLSYTGTIASGQTLVIDTEAQTAKIGSTNAAGSYNGVFPMLPSGNTSVTASSNVTVKWRDKWI